MTSKVLLVLGAGGNIGASTAKLFAEKGYKVAIAARRLQDTVDDEGQLQVQCDLAKTESVEAALDKVKAKFGVPTVIVYNAAGVHPVAGDNPLALSVADFNQDITVNTGSVLVAARRAVQGWEELPAETPKTFIYTGNFLNKQVMPMLFSLGIGKSATSHIIATASKVYAAKGYNFYYADERKEDGSPAFRDLSGPNSAKHYLALAETSAQKPWLQTFVGGHGYKEI